jgi:hypothetical protein
MYHTPETLLNHFEDLR